MVDVVVTGVVLLLLLGFGLILKFIHSGAVLFVAPGFLGGCQLWVARKRVTESVDG